MCIHGNSPNSTFEWFYEAFLQCYRIFNCAIVLRLQPFSCLFFILDMHTTCLRRTCDVQHCLPNPYIVTSTTGHVCRVLQCFAPFLKIFGSSAVVLNSVFLIPEITKYLRVNDLWCLLDAYMCGIHHMPHLYCKPCTKGSMPHTVTSKSNSVAETTKKLRRYAAFTCLWLKLKSIKVLRLLLHGLRLL